MVQRKYVYIMSGLLLGAIFWGCDSPPVTTGDEVTTSTFENIPRSSLEQTISSLGAGAQRYTCSVTTFNEPGAEKEFRHHTSIHFFPDDERISRDNQQTATWSFIYTDESGSRLADSWSYGGHDKVVRVALCSLPDVDGVEEEMAGRLWEAEGTGRDVAVSRQISDYQVHATRIEQNEDQRKLQNNEPNVQLMGGCTGGWFCGTYWVTVATQNGTVISVVTECDPQSWYYIEVCNSSGGGGLPVHPGSGGGSGGNGGGDGDGGSGSCPDPTMPCDSDGNPPDPCSWMMDSPAWMCGIEGILLPVLSGGDFIQDSDTIPDCNDEQEIPWKMDYCNSNEPSGTRLNRTNTALDNIEARGGICEDIAEKGRDILQDGHLRFFPRPDRSSNVAGGRGLPKVEDGVVLLMDEWVDFWYNDTVYVNDNGSQVEVNFEFALAHEIDHAMGEDHISGSLWITPNAKQCSGLN